MQACVQIVLGWLLPVDGAPAQLRIWMDHDSRHPHGFDQTDFYQGLLRGTQLWQFDAEYKVRLRRAEQSLRETGASLAEARERVALVEQAGESAPRDTAGFARRVDDLARRHRLDTRWRDQRQRDRHLGRSRK